MLTTTQPTTQPPAPGMALRVIYREQAEYYGNAPAAAGGWVSAGGHGGGFIRGRLGWGQCLALLPESWDATGSRPAKRKEVQGCLEQLSNEVAALEGLHQREQQRSAKRGGTSATNPEELEMLADLREWIRLLNAALPLAAS